MPMHNTKLQRMVVAYLLKMNQILIAIHYQRSWYTLFNINGFINLRWIHPEKPHPRIN